MIRLYRPLARQYVDAVGTLQGQLRQFARGPSSLREPFTARRVVPFTPEQASFGVAKFYTFPPEENWFNPFCDAFFQIFGVVADVDQYSKFLPFCL